MDVLAAAFNVGHDYEGGVVALAPQIGKNPTTLNQELGRIGSAKLGLHAPALGITSCIQKRNGVPSTRLRLLAYLQSFFLR